MVEHPHTYLLRFGELALKGRNRNRFVDDLVKIIKPRIAPLNGKLQLLHKKVLLHCEAPAAEVRGALSRVFGLTSINPIWRLPHDLDALAALTWKLMEPFNGSGKSFAVRVRRSFKQFSLDSLAMQQNIAAHLFGKGLNLPVDLKNPELPLGITVDFREFWVYLEAWPALGGLPVCHRNIHGLLLSGGIDSPVAGHLIQKRGGSLAAVYFHTPPFTVEAAKEKVIELAQLLTEYQNHMTLFVVNFSETMKTLRACCDESYLVILARRMMMRVASRLMERIKGKSLVTGESLGQVASQTIENIAAINEGVPLPILRPLIGMDKQEIINISKRIGFYPVSIEPFQDCCSLFSPKKPATRAHPPYVKGQERLINVEELVAGALALTEEVALKPVLV